MDSILDNLNTIKQRDPSDALGVIAAQYTQVNFDAEVVNGENDGRRLTNIIVTGMGGSALAALIAKTLFASELTIPFEVVRGYDLPEYVSESSLVIASSYSGNTEETLSALNQATKKGAQTAIITSGGALLDIAAQSSIAHVALPGGVQPRMATIYNLRALFALLCAFGVIEDRWLIDLAGLSDWLASEIAKWTPDVASEQNLAKQIAIDAVGKTQVFYGGQLTAPLAYKWKISFNETAKNVAFWNEYPEFNHNEFMGWTSHPVEKAYAVFDLKSSFERARVLQRFELSDRLLSGKRPHAQDITLSGDTLLAQLLWGAVLADFASAYAAVLNNVDPTPVALIENLKRELADDPR